MSRSESPEAVLQRYGVILDGHFVLKSGKHSAKYINKDEIYTDAVAIKSLCIDLGLPFRDDKRTPDSLVETVIGPAVGGVVLSHCVAHWLSLDGRHVKSVFADKEGKNFVITRGYDKHIRGKRVLVVEDIMTTGGSVRSTVEAVRIIGGTVLGVAALCNRGTSTAESLDVPKLNQLVTMNLETWKAEDCPLCRDGIPINIDVGHGKEFLAKIQEEA
jgi:orotate phosphoribosyltransferase